MSAVSDAAWNIVRDPWQLYYRPRRTFGKLFADPERFFADLMEDSGLRWEGTLVAIMALIAGGAMFATAQFIFSAFPYGIHTLADSFAGRSEGTIGFRTAQLIYATSAKFGIGIVMIWFGYAAIFKVLGWLYNGQGYYVELLKATAWGMIPAGLGSAIYAAGVAATFWAIEVESTLTGETSQVQRLFLLNQGRNEWWVIALEVLMIALTLASIYFLQYAVKEVHEITLERARVLVAIPVILHALWLLNNLLSHTIWTPEVGG